MSDRERAQALYDLASKQYMSILARNTEIIKKRPLTPLELEETIRFQNVSVMCLEQLDEVEQGGESRQNP